MPTFVIEREIPGASKLADEELRGITTKSNDAVAELSRPCTWRHSYVSGDKIYCVHEAGSADDILEHARGGGFPATRRRVPRQSRERDHGRVRQHQPARAAGLTTGSRLAS